MINDLVIDRVSGGPVDPRGNAFVTWITQGQSARFFDDALNRHDVKHVYLRALESSGGGRWRVRFTAYDKDGACISSKVCEDVKHFSNGGTMDTKDGQQQETQVIKPTDVGNVVTEVLAAKTAGGIGEDPGVGNDTAGEPEKKNPAASIQEQAKQANDATLGASTSGMENSVNAQKDSSIQGAPGTAAIGSAANIENDFNKASDLQGARKMAATGDPRGIALQSSAHPGVDSGKISESNTEKQTLETPLNGTAAGDILDRIRSAINDFEHAVALELHQDARDAHAFMVDCVNELRGHFRSS